MKASSSGNIVNAIAVFGIPFIASRFIVESFKLTETVSTSPRELILKGGWLIGSLGAFIYTLVALRWMLNGKCADKIMYTFLLVLFASLAALTGLIT